MKHSPRQYGLVLTDLLGCGAVLALAGAIGLPTLERTREMSKRMTCAINLKGVGLAGAAYATENSGNWMVPAFKNAATDFDGIDYLGDNFPSPENAGQVGYERERQSTSESLVDPAGGSTAVTTTRAYWMLVRSGAVSMKQFICPSSLHDQSDPTEMIDLYYDFTQYNNISYGYLVPFGPREIRPQEGRDSRVVFAADKGPHSPLPVNLDPYSSGPGYNVLRLADPPRYWQKFNSPNHGGRGTGEGQNALFADGRVEFHRIPAFGADNDNIYTLMSGDWDPEHFNVIHGDGPALAPYPNPYPGQQALNFEPGPGSFSTTDSLIYP